MNALSPTVVDEITRATHLAIAAPAGSSISAPLADISAEYVALEAEYLACCRDEDSLDAQVRAAAAERLAAIGDRQQALFDAATDIPSSTLADLRAKAAIVHCKITADPDFVNAAPASYDDNMAWSLCQDLLLPRTGTSLAELVKAAAP